MSGMLRPEDIQIELIAEPVRLMRYTAMREHADARRAVTAGDLMLAVARYEASIARLIEAHTLQEALTRVAASIAESSSPPVDDKESSSGERD